MGRVFIYPLTACHPSAFQCTFCSLPVGCSVHFRRPDAGLLTVSNEFFDERWSKRRTVTSLEWSNVFPELLLASYHRNEEAVHEPEGVCLIWNMKFPKKNSPEYIFHCQSPLTSATLSKFHPNLIIGGTYSGQIVLWDSR